MSAAVVLPLSMYPRLRRAQGLSGASIHAAADVVVRDVEQALAGAGLILDWPRALRPYPGCVADCGWRVVSSLA
jgi:hypothetical protein